eukprot:TRINITY_DN72177_c0_g1_i1.p2 TRINITY_DN72177_c0_g1~~TRINITY_DN72177_c0_g1_i1.p2  ORF type:complete len:123 (+),score=19.49 TRINITY_DN72177_c0_g1_i1:120-488(+)
MEDDRLATEVYSFVSFVLSLVALPVWLIWILAPDEVLHSWGVTYYFDRWWALALPAQLLVTGVFIIHAYVALNMMACCPLDSPDMIADSSTAVTSELYGDYGEIPDIVDVDLSVVNKHMFFS